MSLNFFNARWLRLFVEAGLARPTGNEEMFFTEPDPDLVSSSLNEMSVGFKNTNLNVRGTRRTKFYRYRLDRLFKNVSPVVYVYTPRTKAEVAQALIDRYGLPLKAEWFEDGVISKTLGDNPPFNIEMNLVRSNFTDNENADVTVQVRQASVSVADIFKSNVLEAPGLPFVVRQGYTNTELKTYTVDFTPEVLDDYKILRGISTSEQLYSVDGLNLTSSMFITQLLHERLGVPVTVEGDIEGALSLRAANFVYNGPTSGFPGSDPWHDHVLVFDTVIDPVSSVARTYRGRCYIHYNELS